MRSALSRRSFFGLAGAATVMVACGKSSSPPSAAAGEQLVQFFDPNSVAAGTGRRLVVGLADGEGVLKKEGPAELSAQLTGANDTVLGSVRGRRRGNDLPRAYYEFRVDLPAPGTYGMVVERPSGKLEVLFAAQDPATLPFPGVGAPLPPFDTPTTAAARGVDPVCTREPPCPFHTMTLTDALAARRPVAYLVGTPAFCKTGICGPVLDVMIGLKDRFPNVTFLHSEVYTDETLQTLAPAVEALGLPFEPVLFLTDTKGTVAERLDVIFDTEELTGSLQRISS